MTWWRHRIPGPVGHGPGASDEGAVPTDVHTPGPLGVNDAGDPTVETSPVAVTGMAAPEKYWVGSVKGNLGEHPNVRHTINNFGDTELRYLLRIKNTGYCLLDLGTQYEDRVSEEVDREWIPGVAKRGETLDFENGVPPHSSLHLRLFGEKDFTAEEQLWVEGTLQVFLLS